MQKSNWHTKADFMRSVPMLLKIITCNYLRNFHKKKAGDPKGIGYGKAKGGNQVAGVTGRSAKQRTNLKGYMLTTKFAEGMATLLPIDKDTVPHAQTQKINHRHPYRRN
jgi:hypothetical protein